MRVAVCISGQARSLTENYENILTNLVAPNNADVFVHTWYDPSEVGQRFCGKKEKEKNFINKTTLEENTPELIEKYFKPKGFLHQKQIQFVDNEVLDMSPSDPKNPYYNKWYIRPQFCLSMFWSIMKCNELKNDYEKEKDFTYDAVIRTRFDLRMTREYKMSQFDLNFIHANGHSHASYAKQDVFAFSNSSNMDCYSNVFSGIPFMMSQGVEFCPELLLGAHLWMSKKEVSSFPGGYSIVR